MFNLDCMELFPHNHNNGINKPPQSKIEVCIGSQAYNKLKASKVFIVGAGAIGCELLKNLALLNIGTSANGGITITDPDVIENSNLSR